MPSRYKGLLAGGAAGAALACAALAFAAGQTDAPGRASQGRDVSAGLSAPAVAPLSFADIIQRVSPAVVSIDVSGKADPSEVALPFNGLPFAFTPPGGDDDGDGAEIPPHVFRRLTPQSSAPRMQATGSGFFISADGYVLTNNHVIKGADVIRVRTADKRILKAKLIGRDPATDIAVIKVEGSGYPFVSFEKSGKPRVGDWVVAVGNPFGLGGTATAGIVSALGRENVSDNNLVDYMQIDAPINKGNSGGPTFDVYGRVVGVNTAIFSPSGGSVGIGFDIPADVADSVSRRLIAHGRIEHGYLGATIQGLTPEVAESLGLRSAEGALVAGLAPGGPAVKSGLETGDVILSVNGRVVASAADLTRQVAFAAPGDSLRLSLLRNGKATTVTVRAGVRPSEAELARADAPATDGADAPEAEGASAKVLGLKLAPLTAASRAELGLNDAAKGVLVTGVAPDSDAAEKGLRPGDLIVRAGGVGATTPKDVGVAVAEARRDHRPSVLLMISRDGRNAFVPLKVAAG